MNCSFEKQGGILLGPKASRSFNEHSWLKKQSIMIPWHYRVAASLTESPPSFSSIFCTLSYLPKKCTLSIYLKLLNFVFYSLGKSKNPIYIFFCVYFNLFIFIYLFYFNMYIYICILFFRKEQKPYIYIFFCLFV